mgnify:CR=1
MFQKLALLITPANHMQLITSLHKARLLLYTKHNNMIGYSVKMTSGNIQMKIF